MPIPVPSPQQIHQQLFPLGTVQPAVLPSVWNAQALLTPFGGQIPHVLQPSDQLVIANVTYDASTSDSRFLRVGLYLLESLLYYDFLFETTSRQTRWWWLLSDPGDPNAVPAKAIGPFSTSLEVPPINFLSRNALKHAGTWRIRGRSCHAFSGRKQAMAGSWFWLDPASGDLTRIMSIDPTNDFQIPLLGAYYLADFPRVTKLRASNLQAIYQGCADAVPPAAPDLPIATLSEILAAMASPPAGGLMPCTLHHIQSPGRTE